MNPGDAFAALRQRGYSAGTADLALTRALARGSFSLSRHLLTWTEPGGYILMPQGWPDGAPRPGEEDPAAAGREQPPGTLSGMSADQAVIELQRLTGLQPAATRHAVEVAGAPGQGYQYVIGPVRVSHGPGGFRIEALDGKPLRGGGEPDGAAIPRWPDLSGGWDVAEICAAIAIVDQHLDDAAPEVYQGDHPASRIANMQRRIGKAQLEAAEAMEELSLLTGENPRKGAHPEARERMLDELGDTAAAALLGIQSQVKDTEVTWAIFVAALAKGLARVPRERPEPGQ